MAAEVLLEVEDLRTEFFTSRGIVKAVNGVSFSVSRGELVGIVGETACGKSATIRSIIGLVRPPGRVVSGSARFESVELIQMPRRKLRAIRGSSIGFVPQNPFGALNPILSIERQFRNVIRAHESISRPEVRTRALQMLTDVGIPDPERVLRGHAHELSGGMAQRTVIALSMILGPKLVIADEPTTGLDVTVQRQILDLIRDLLEREHSAMLLVTHDLGVVAQYCQRVIVMYAGKVVETGPVKKVFKTPAHSYTKALLGAIPRPGADLVTISGTVPDPINYPAGCPFYARCPNRSDPRCETESPPLTEVSEGHFAASFYHVTRDQSINVGP